MGDYEKVDHACQVESMQAALQIKVGVLIYLLSHLDTMWVKGILGE